MGLAYNSEIARRVVMRVPVDVIHVFTVSLTSLALSNQTAAGFIPRRTFLLHLLRGVVLSVRALFRLAA